MTTAPNNEIFKAMFSQAKQENNLEVLKELKAIGDMAMTWNRMATFYSNDTRSVNRISTAAPEYIQTNITDDNTVNYVKLCYPGDNENYVVLDRGTTFYGYTLNDDGMIMGKPLSKCGWTAFVALLEEWANNGKIEVVRG